MKKTIVRSHTFHSALHEHFFFEITTTLQSRNNTLPSKKKSNGKKNKTNVATSSTRALRGHFES